MYRLKECLICLFAVILILNFQNKSFGEESEIYDILNVIQKDLKTLEKAVYSGDSFSTSQSSDSSLSQDTLTRHLLKLSDIEQQFQELTNKFEEINFKIDKLSNRISVISYGKERPVNAGSDLLAWSQNRRSVTVKAN